MLLLAMDQIDPIRAFEILLETLVVPLALLPALNLELGDSIW